MKADEREEEATEMHKSTHTHTHTGSSSKWNDKSEDMHLEQRAMIRYSRCLWCLDNRNARMCVWWSAHQTLYCMLRYFRGSPQAGVCTDSLLFLTTFLYKHQHIANWATYWGTQVLCAVTALQGGSGQCETYSYRMLHWHGQQSPVTAPLLPLGCTAGHN